MPGHKDKNPRKVKRVLKKLFKGKSADKGLKELSEKKFQPGTSEPIKTPQTDVMGNPIPTAKSGEPQMRDSEGRLMTPAEQRRAIKAAERAERLEEKAKKKKKRKLRTPQTDVMGRRIG
tara:strand:- start:146 stop:502 length:357 start_codon:yes stop_codon:yes gene_type:complete